MKLIFGLNLNLCFINVVIIICLVCLSFEIKGLVRFERENLFKDGVY